MDVSNFVNAKSAKSAAIENTTASHGSSFHSYKKIISSI